MTTSVPAMPFTGPAPAQRLERTAAALAAKHAQEPWRQKVSAACAAHARLGMCTGASHGLYS
jgi:hypothetical protein